MTRSSARWICRALLAACGLFPVAALAGEDATIFGVQSRRTSTLFPLFRHINDDSTIANPGAALFNLSDGIYGAAFREGTFFAIHRGIGSAQNFLATIAHTGTAFGLKVGANDIGFPNIEALANVGGQLVAASIDEFAQTTSLVSVDCKSGLGTLIGTGPAGVIIVALAYDPVAGRLYGAGLPSAAGEPAVDEPGLYTIDPLTSEMARVGGLGTTIQGLAWSANLGLVGTFDHLYQINTITGQATRIGATDYTNGLGTGAGIRNGIYGVAALVPGAATPFRVGAITRDGAGQVEIVWGGDVCSRYQIQYSALMAGGKWEPVSGILPGEAGSMSYTHAGAADEEAGFYRVVRLTP